MIMLFIFGCVSKDAKMEELIAHARDYIKTDEIIAQGGKGFLADYKERSKIEENIVKSQTFDVNILESLLKSENNSERKKALVIVMIKKITDDKLLETIIYKYKANDDYFTKFYSQYCMLNASDKQISSLSEKIFNIYLSETNEAIIIIGMQNLMRLDNTVSIPFFVKYFKTGSLEVKRAAYVYLKKADGIMLENVMSRLKEDKAYDALKIIDGWERGDQGSRRGRP